MGIGEPNEFAERHVTHKELEMAAKSYCDLAAMMEDFPELAEKMREIRVLLAGAAEAFTSGNIEKSTQLYRAMKKECAILVSGQAA